MKRDKLMPEPKSETTTQSLDSVLNAWTNQ